MTDFSDYQWLVGPEAEDWLKECAHSAGPSQNLQQRLRKVLSAERARLVVQQASLRAKATEKFGERSQQMFFTDVALQQATDQGIAAYKASRFATEKPLIDYCCGIGGDLIALAGRAATVGWDRAPELGLFAEKNLHAWNCVGGSHVCVGDVQQHPPSNEVYWHLDPDRRADGRRSTQMQWHSPNEATIDDWLSGAPNGAVKLAPATRVSEEWQTRAEFEWISRNRECRQLVAWFGDLAHSTGLRRATCISQTVNSFVGDRRVTALLAEQIENYVFDTDPAIRAAGLTGALAAALDCRAIAPGKAYLTAEEPLKHPMLSRFRVIEILPLRISELAKYVRTLGLGDLEIKVRGVSVRPEDLRRKLKLAGSRSVTLLLTRQGKREIAILAEREELPGVTNAVANL